MKQLVFLALLYLFSNIIAVQKFTVKDFEKNFCFGSLGYINIDINGDFSEETSIFDNIDLELSTSSNTKIKAECSPYDKRTFFKDYLSCKIDICLYPYQM